MTTAATPVTPASVPLQIGVGAQYIKDFSFECPNVPHIFAPTQAGPELQMGVNVHSRAVAENNYEVLLALRLEAKLDSKIAFIAELAYGGVFAVPAMAEEQLKQFLMIEAPKLLFPFARSILMNTVTNAGFPQILISPIDFTALYLANKNNIGTMNAVGAA